MGLRGTCVLVGRDPSGDPTMRFGKKIWDQAELFRGNQLEFQWDLRSSACDT